MQNSGTFVVQIQDSNNCISIDTVSILKDSINLSVYANLIKCYGTKTTNAWAYVSNGLYPFSYQWSTGGTTVPVNSVGVGNQSVTVYDSRGCQSTAQFNVIEPPEITFTISQTPDNLDTELGDGTATVNVTGGYPPYTYLWNDSLQQTSETAQNLRGGEYLIRVTDSAGCVRTTNVELAVSGEPHLTMYPTPATQKIYLQFHLMNESEVTYSIANSLGKIVLKQQGQVSKAELKEVDISQLPQGYYLVVVQVAEKKFSFKLEKI